MSAVQASFFRRRPVATVVGIAAIVRLVVGITRGPSILKAGNGLYFMLELAESLASSGDYSLAGVPSVFHQPAYIWLLALGRALPGPAWFGSLLCFVAVGALQVWLTARIARRLDSRAAVPAAAIVALHPVLVWHGLGVADTTLFSVASLGWLDATLGAMRHRSWTDDVVAGIWLGLAALTRPALVPLAPLGVIAIGLASRSPRRALRHALTVASVALVLASPWLIRNHGLTGKFPLIGTHGPESVWAANSPMSPAVTAQDSTYDEVSWRHIGTEFDVGEFQSRVTPAEAIVRERGFREAAFEWIAQNPGSFARMYVTRLARLWSPLYHPTQRGETRLPGADARSAVHALVYVPTLILALWGVVLVWRARRRRWEVALVVGFAVAYTLGNALGAGYTRVRLPIEPLLIALAAVTVAARPWRRANSGS